MSESFVARGGLWVIGQSVLMLGVLGVGVMFRGQWTGAMSTIAGTVFAVTGAWFGIAGVQALGKNRTAFPRPQAGSTLVRTGVYRIVRHPLYTSVSLLVLAWGLLWRSGPALVLASVLIVFLDAKARREERWLREIFEDYAEYSRQVRRIIPWLY